MRLSIFFNISRPCVPMLKQSNIKDIICMILYNTDITIIFIISVFNFLFIFFSFRWVLEAMQLQLNMDKEHEKVENLSPYAIRQLLQKILTVKDWAQKEQ